MAILFPMKRATRPLPFLFVILLFAGCAGDGGEDETATSQAVPDTLRMPEEYHLRNVRQLTFGGENAEAYFSPDGKRLSLQSTHPPYECDQIFSMSVEGGELELVSSGEGRTTCAYYMPDNASILYASTHLGSKDCPPRPDFSQGYVWPVYSSFDIFVRRPDGSLDQITSEPGYDAEATVSPQGDRMVFTSTRDGDLDIYTMNLDGSDVVRLTDELGYDGGPFFSPDGSEIVFRASHPTEPDDQEDYLELLARDLIRPGVLNLYVMDADGSNRRLVLENGAANFAPFFFPDGERILFVSNMDDPKGRNFELYMIHKNGTGLKRVTFNESFDGFPMFSPDGKYLVFASNRFNRERGETNIFLAEWVD